MKHYSEFNIKKLSLPKNKKGTCNNIFTLDIETTSAVCKDGKAYSYDTKHNPEYYKEYNKIGVCYIWMLSIDDNVYYGRYLSELKDFVFTLNKMLKERKGIIYVHNLGFEFQFLRNVFEFDEVFARQMRKPMKCHIKETGFTLKCSYILSNLSLDKLASEYNLPITKKSGQLDYNKLRHSDTPLTNEELEYCEYDCLVLYEFIKYMVGLYGNLIHIPMTSTARIRREFQQYLKEINPKYGVQDWKNKVSLMTPDEESFLKLVKCYAGGYVHSNPYHTNKLLKNVASIDFTSSYPACMLAEQYPMGIFSCVTIHDMADIDAENYAYILHVKFSDLIIKPNIPMTYISHDKSNCTGMICDNGRIFSAKTCEMTITEIDLDIINRCYDYSNIEFLDCEKCIKTYLPKVFIDFIIRLYNRKSVLKQALHDDKNNEELQEAYRLSKAFLNSLYGMCVTNYIVDEILYDESWDVKRLDLNNIGELLSEMKEKKKALLPYQWGVWITAYARRNLWDGIIEIGNDAIYSDTDSIKYINNHDDLIAKYNNKIDDKLIKMCEYFEIDFELIKGIGRFDFEGISEEFKTLGAKRYVGRKNGELYITVSGVNKKTGINALNNNVNNFTNKLIFNYADCGKLIHYYNDEQEPIIIKDYKGESLLSTQKFGICLCPTIYSMSLSDDYISFLNNTAHASVLL